MDLKEFYKSRIGKKSRGHGQEYKILDVMWEENDFNGGVFSWLSRNLEEVLEESFSFEDFLSVAVAVDKVFCKCFYEEANDGLLRDNLRSKFFHFGGDSFMNYEVARNFLGFLES